MLLHKADDIDFNSIDPYDAKLEYSLEHWEECCCCPRPKIMYRYKFNIFIGRRILGSRYYHFLDFFKSKYHNIRYNITMWLKKKLS